MMDPHFNDALVAMEADLRVNLSIEGILPLLERAAGGFMVKEEKMYVTSVNREDTPAMVSRIIEILRKKGNAEFYSFLDILDKSGNNVWAGKLGECVSPPSPFKKMSPPLSPSREDQPHPISHLSSPVLTSASKSPEHTESISSSSLSTGRDPTSQPLQDAKPSWIIQYERAIKQKIPINLRIIRCVLAGPPNVGKSCLNHLLVHSEPCKITESTPMFVSPDVITFKSDLYKTDSQSSEWIHISPDHMEQILKKMTGTVQEENIASPSSQISNSDAMLPDADLLSNPEVPEVVRALTEANDGLLQDLDAKDDLSLHTHLNNLNVVHMLDSGGQLAFQDTLPLLVNTPCTFLVVFNASLDLNEPMEITYRPQNEPMDSADRSQSEPIDCIDCSQDGSEARLKLSQQKMMLRMFSSIHAMQYKCHRQVQQVCQEGSSPPSSRIIVVGTHKDILEQRDDRKELEANIAKIVEEIREARPYCIESSSDKEYILIDTLTKPDCDVKELRQAISAKSNTLSLKLPMAWLLVELTTQRLKKKIIRYEELKQFCCQKKYVNPEEADTQFRSLLLVLHSLGFYAFYELEGVSDTDNWVCTNATTLYREVSKLLVIQFMKNPTDTYARHFYEYGIIKQSSCTKLFRALKIDVVDPVWFINVLIHIGIAARLKGEEENPLFFVPLALPFNRTDLPSTASVSRLCFTLEYPVNPGPFLKPRVTDLPRGIFPRLAVYLSDQRQNEDDNWLIDAKKSDRTHIKFNYKNSDIYLIEETGYVEVAILLHEPFFSEGDDRISEVHDLCQKLRNTIDNAISCMCEEIFGKHPNKQPTVKCGFKCLNCKVKDAHLAFLNEDQASARCSLNDASAFKLEPRSRIWFSKVVKDDEKQQTEFAKNEAGTWIMADQTALQDPPPPQSTLLNPDDPTMEEIQDARLHYLKLLRKFQDNKRQYGLEVHQGYHSGQECVDLKSVSNLGQCVFRIVRKGNTGGLAYGTGFIVKGNESLTHWILSCCHNFIFDEEDQELLKDGRGNEIEDIKNKIKKQMKISLLILPDDDYHLRNCHKIHLREVADVDSCLLYPEHDICAIRCKPIPKEHQNRVLPSALNENYIPQLGDMLYIIQNPHKLSNDRQNPKVNKEVHLSMGLLWHPNPKDRMIGYDAVTFGGSSGSPIVFPSKDGLLLIGVHRKGDRNYNWGSLLPRELIRTIM